VSLSLHAFFDGCDRVLHDVWGHGLERGHMVLQHADSDWNAGWQLRRRLTEPFSSCDFAGLKDVDGFGQLPGAPGAAAEFAQDAPGLELGVGPFARAA
jgi:hypothetical protein